jgi:hypothetical protein
MNPASRTFNVKEFDLYRIKVILDNLVSNVAVRLAPLEQRNAA